MPISLRKNLIGLHSFSCFCYRLCMQFGPRLYISRLFRKPLDDFLKKIGNPEIYHQFILSPSFNNIESKEGNQIFKHHYGRNTVHFAPVNKARPCSHDLYLTHTLLE